MKNWEDLGGTGRSVTTSLRMQLDDIACTICLCILHGSVSDCKWKNVGLIGLSHRLILWPIKNLQQSRIVSPRDNGEVQIESHVPLASLVGIFNFVVPCLPTPHILWTFPASVAPSEETVWKQQGTSEKQQMKL